MTECLERCKAYLQEQGVTCAMLKGDSAARSSLNGIAPLINWLEENPAAMQGCCVADKVIGKAAALVMVYGGVSEVYAEILSEPAAKCFENNNIAFYFGKKVPCILNRSRSGPCPMESRCLQMDSPQKAYEILRETAKK